MRCGLTDWLRRPGSRRLVALVLLLALVAVLFHGTAHGHDGGSYEHCVACAAREQSATVDGLAVPEPLLAPTLVEVVPPARPRAPLAAEPRRSHATRAPPVAA